MGEIAQNGALCPFPGGRANCAPIFIWVNVDFPVISPRIVEPREQARHDLNRSFRRTCSGLCIRFPLTYDAGIAPIALKLILVEMNRVLKLLVQLGQYHVGIRSETWKLLTVIPAGESSLDDLKTGYAFAGRTVNGIAMI